MSKIFENKLLFTGRTKEEAKTKAEETLKEIEKKLSEWKGRPISFDTVHEMKPYSVGDTTYYYYIAAPLQQWKANFSSVNYDRKQIFQNAWKLDEPELMK
jgi:hypothetical protein